MKKITLISGGIILLTIALFTGLKKTPASELIIATNTPPPPEAPFVPYVLLDNLKIPVEIADDGPEVTKGLSGKLSLPKDSGMYFIFPNPDRYRFWMPDMHFPIDIIWIEGGKVVGISADVSNEFDPMNPKFYLPPVPVRYVLEVNAGFAKANGIKVGTAVTTYFNEPI